MTSIWPAFLLSLRIATAATVLTMAIGIPLAFTISRHRFRGRSNIEGIIMIALGLAPTLVGYFLIMMFGARGWVGMWLNRWFGYSIVFRFEGAVLAAAVVAMPLLYLPAKGAFAAVDREFLDIAKTFGASTLQLFWHVSLPMARRGILGGLLLVFARAIGEFGATVMVFGWQSHRIPLPILIYRQYEQGELSAATGAVIALTLASLGLIFA